MVSSGGDGIYGSVDGGRSWKKMNRGIHDLNVQKIIISPYYHIDATILAANGDGSLYRTTDRGKTWHSILSDGRIVTAMAFLPPSGDGKMLAGDSKGTLSLFDGSHWHQLHSYPEGGGITAITPSPLFEEDRACWIGTERKGVLTSNGNWKTLSPSNNGISDTRITSLFAFQHPDDRFRLYASTWYDGVFRSIDHGKTWHKCDQGLSTDIQADKPNFLLPHFKGIDAVPGFMMLGGFDGLFVSRNGGDSWRQLQTWPIGYISTLALSPVMDEGRQSAVLAYGGGAYYIEDLESVDWVEDAQSLTLAGVKGKRTDSGISDVAFSPSFESDHTIFAATEHELIRTEDMGRNWKRVVIRKPILFRLRSKLDYYLRRLGVPSSVRLKIAGFFPLIPGWSTYVSVSPTFLEDGVVFFSTQGLGQCKSTDGGKSCAIVFDTALKMTTSMAISPKFDQDKTIFVGIRGDGVFKSSNGGKTFREVYLASAAEGDLKLAVSPGYDQDQTIFVGTGNGLFKSADGGHQWHRIGGSDLPHRATIYSIAVSPDFNQDKTVIVAVKGFGIFKSMDGGEFFAAVGDHLINDNEQLKQVLFSGNYAQNSTLYGVTTENVYQSRDGGESWGRIRRPVRYEDVQDAITFHGDWKTESGGEFSDSTQTRSNAAGSTASLRFYGSGVRLIGERAPENGMAIISVDDKMPAHVFLRTNERMSGVVVYEASDLSTGLHEIEVEVSDHKDDAGWVAVDAFEILP